MTITSIVGPMVSALGPPLGSARRPASRALGEWREPAAGLVPGEGATQCSRRDRRRRDATRRDRRGAGRGAGAPTRVRFYDFGAGRMPLPAGARGAEPDDRGGL